MRLIIIGALALAASPCLADQPGPTPAPSVPLPALGADWMPEPEQGDAATDPDRWPRGNATATGLDNMINDERLSAHLRGGDHLSGGRAFRALSGGYLVVPVLKLHFPHSR